mmetsp:Transcript_15613/g.39686  ORF Transcript_15613/g.39686 Transcript_15613/m.39686 type:complete len:782 (+) Transcript_15613:94-2439(+)
MEGGGEAGGGPVRRSRVDSETVAYLSEIVQTAGGLEDAEQKSLMLSNALDEIAGAELRVLSDAECSRLVEEMLALGDINISIKLLTIFSDGDKFFELSSSMFGSHVAEKLLDAVSSQLEAADERERESVEETLSALVQSVTEYLMDFAMDRSASHVVRALLNTLCGREITPPSKGRPGKPSANKKKKKKQAPVGLAAKVVLDASLAYEVPPDPLFPKLVNKLCREVINAPQELVSQLVEDTYGNPFLQVLLVATHHDSKQLVHLAARLLGASPEAAATSDSPLTAAPTETVLGVAQHRIGSHLAELLVRLLPREEMAALYGAVFQGSLLELAQHQTANFVVQSVIASTSDPAVVEAMLAELGPQVGDLLSRRRSGVVAALTAACGRNGTNEVAMCRELSRGLLKRSANAAASTQPGALVEALVTLDTNLRLDGETGSAVAEERFSAPGCAMLATVMRFPPIACQKFTESFSAITGADIVRLACDSGGCRVVEAFVESNANPKLKVKLMKKLKGSWAQMVLRSGAAAITVERCYDAGKMADKEVIVGELAAKEAEIMAKHYGAALLSRLGVSAFKRDVDTWRRRVGSTSNIKREFMDMLEDGPAVPASQGGSGGKQGGAGSAPSSGGQRNEEEVKAEEPEEAEAFAGGGSAVDIEHMLLTGADAGAPKKARKGKHDKQTAAAGPSSAGDNAAGDSDGEEAEDQEAPKVKSKTKKHKLRKGGNEDGEPEGKKKKKKQKDDLVDASLEEDVGKIKKKKRKGKGGDEAEVAPLREKKQKKGVTFF